MDRTPIRQWSTRRDRALDRDPLRDHRNPARRRSPAQESAWRLRQFHQLVEGAWLVRKPAPSSVGPKRNGAPLHLAFVFTIVLSGCTTFKPHRSVMMTTYHRLP